MFKSLFDEQRISIQQGLVGYAADMADSLKATIKAADELKIYREQILIELLAKRDQQLAESEGRIYAAMQPKVAAQNKALLAEVVKQERITRTLLFGAVFVLLVMLLVSKF